MSAPVRRASASTKVGPQFLLDEAALRAALESTYRRALAELLGEHEPISVEVMEIVARAQVVALCTNEPGELLRAVLASLPRPGRVVLPQGSLARTPFGMRLVELVVRLTAA